MSLLDAKEYDPRPAQRRKRIIIIAILLIIVGSIGWYFFRYWPEEHVVNKFFQALQQKDFDKAYGIYFADPDWKQHSAKYSNYSMSQFMLDWGPSSQYGVITAHHIDCAAEPPKRGFSSPSGVIVVVTINNLADPKAKSQLWVEKKSKTISPSYMDVDCRPGSQLVKH